MPQSNAQSRPRISPAAATLALLIALNLLNYIDRYILPGEVSLIKADFHSTDQQMGLLTTALFLVYMIAAPLTGWLGDHFRRKPLIIAGALLWSVATLTTAWVHDYRTLFIRHAIVGIGEATFGIFAPAVIADFYPERDRNRILSIFYLAIPVGAALGYVAGGEDAPPEVEMRYIEQVRQQFYGSIIDGPALINEENFSRYGASTTPTFVLIDRNGIVKMYHPGGITYDELRPRIEALFR